MPIISTLASASSRGYGQLILSSGTSFELIQSITAASNVNEIQFNSIPDTYKHLRIFGSLRTTQTGTGGSALSIQFNGDTGNNYWSHRLYATSTTKSTDGSQSSNPQIGNGASTGLNANLWQPNIIDIVDYRSDKHKTARGLSGGDWVSAAGYLMYCDTIWTNTNPITQIRLYHSTDQIATNSIFSLYGMRG